MELARTYLITGFPWNLLGYAVQASGVRQIASVTGVYGLSFLAVATSALLAWVLLSPRRARAGLALAGWLVLLLACPVEAGSASRGRWARNWRFSSNRTCPWTMRSWKPGFLGATPPSFSSSFSSASPRSNNCSPDQTNAEHHLTPSRSKARRSAIQNRQLPIQNPRQATRRCWSGRKTPRRFSSPATRFFATPWKTWRARRTPS